MKRHVLHTLIACFFFAPAAVAQDAPSVLDKVRGLLSGHEFIPTAKDFKKVAPDAEVIAALKTLAADKDPLISERSISSMGHFATPEVRAFLSGQAGNAKAKSAARGTALMALGYAFKNAALDDIVPHLKAKNADLREDAVLALMPMSSLKAAELLTAHLKTEKAAHIQLTIKRVTKSIKSNHKRAQIKSKKTNNLGGSR